MLLLNICLEGCGVDKNVLSAVEWFRKAAEQGHADAQLMLGMMYEEGCGVDEDDSIASAHDRI